jgi:hypothetical protein
MLNAMHLIVRSLPQAARREVPYRLSLSQFAPDDRTPEQLLDMALQRAWPERMRLSPMSAEAQRLLAGARNRLRAEVNAARERATS